MIFKLLEQAKARPPKQSRKRQMESMNEYFEQTFGNVDVQNLMKNLGEIQDMDEEKLKEVLKN